MTLKEQFLDIWQDIEVSEPEELQANDNLKHEIAATAAFLIGVPDRFLKTRTDYFDSKLIKKLSLEKRARIIRDLCMIRTSFIRFNRSIYRQMSQENKGLYTITEIPQDALAELESDGILLAKNGKNYFKNEYMKDMNALIGARINDCRTFFPEWIPWDYIRDMFLMPGGSTDKGIKECCEEYYANFSNYPYGCFANGFSEDVGNVFASDLAFVKALYHANGDVFGDFSKVQDVGAKAMKDMSRFFNKAGRIDIVVDCENSDPYRMCSCLNTINRESGDKIHKILLINDVHASTGWEAIRDYTDIPVEEIMLERLYEHKSLVDIRLAAETTKEHFKYDVDSFILVSSDSDFWTLIDALPSADFMIMLEHEKCGSIIRDKLADEGYSYCFLNDFYSGDQDAIAQKVITSGMVRAINDMHINVEDLYENVVTRSRSGLDSAQQSALFAKLVSRLQFSVNSDGCLAVSAR